MDKTVIAPSGKVIDLTKPQIISEDVLVEVRSNEFKPWLKCYLQSIPSYAGVFVWKNGNTGEDNEYDPFHTTYYPFVRPIKEPKKRLMTRAEVLGFVTHNASETVVRIITHQNNKTTEGDWFPACGFAFTNGIENYEYAYIDEDGTIHDIRKFEVIVEDEE